MSTALTSVAVTPAGSDGRVDCHIDSSRRDRLADWLGLNRATLAVLVVIGCLGLSEEIWSNFLSLHLWDESDIATAVLYVGAIASAKNLLEGFGYIAGGTLAHRLGPRAALAISAAPMAAGFTIMLMTHESYIIAIGAILMTNWEPLSVPATFDVVGSELPKNRRTIAFAVQSIQKRVPKMIGPAIGGFMIAAVGYWLNLVAAFGLVGLAVVLQLLLTRRMRPKPEPVHVPMRVIMRTMPHDLKRLLQAEIFIRWGDWFARDFTVLYVVQLLTFRFGWSDPSARYWAGALLSLTAATALATYIPVAKLVDRSPSPRPFIGVTFLLFAVFPISLVVLPRIAAAAGLPVLAALAIGYTLNGLREIGEPARKALISTGFAPEIRARAIGIYWGVRSFAFFPAPLVAALLWWRVGPDATFLIGGTIGLIGTLLYALTGAAQSRAAA